MSRRRTSYGQSKPPAGTPALRRDAPGSAAWLLNETGGTTARDSFGTDHATLVGTTLARNPAAAGGWGAISGFTSAAYLTTTRTQKTAYTLVARFRTPNTGSYPNLFSAVGSQYILHAWNAGVMSFWTSTEFASGTSIGATLTANRWYTMAFVREGNSITGGYKLYYDGVLSGTANTGTLAAPTNPFWIGMRSDGFPQPWDGLIDWVQWYERAMSAAEILRLYHEPFRAWAPPGPRFLWTPGPPPPPPPLTGEAALTQGAQTLSAAGSVSLAGAASPAQSAQTTSAAGTVSVAGASALTSAADSLSSAGIASVAGAAGLTQAANIASGAGAASVDGAASPAQGGDTTAGAGSLTIAGASSATQSGNTLASAATNAVGGTGPLTQSADSLGGAGACVVGGAGAPTQADHSCAAAGLVTIGGSGVPVQSDAVAASGAVAILGAAALVQSGQTLYASGGEPPSVAVDARWARPDRSAGYARSSRDGRWARPDRSAVHDAPDRDVRWVRPNRSPKWG